MNEPKITVIFLIYNDARYAAGLVDGILKQGHPKFLNQSEWLNVIFMDNGSRDGTDLALKNAIEKAGSPSHFHLEVNPQNMGISRALNKAFGMAKTPYALTCHCDVLFGREDYLAKMVELMDANPKAGAITGQPAVSQGKVIPFAEKVNLIANLMDIFPENRNAELVPVGFAESRCDAFRLDALKAAGFYDTTLRLAGEDQIMAARMRSAGYELYQAPHLPYFLSVSNDQDSLAKLVKHMRLFGRAHPYILLKNENTTAAVMGKSAGANRKARVLLRVMQLGSVAAYLFALFALVLGASPVVWLAPILLSVLAKVALFFKYFKVIPLSGQEYLRFFGFQPFLDISYTVGLVQGLWLVSLGHSDIR